MNPLPVQVRPFAPALSADFFNLHSPENGHGWCFCTAWWTPTWDGWGERSAKQNRAFRDRLLQQGEYDGYLLYVGDEPAGWCQVGRRDRLVKLAQQFELPPDPHTWAITCFLIAPPYRRHGLARRLLDGVLQDLRLRAVRRVEAYPKRGEALDELDLWNGPETLFLQAGFRVVKENTRRPVLMLEL